MMRYKAFVRAGLEHCTPGAEIGDAYVFNAVDEVDARRYARESFVANHGVEPTLCVVDLVEGYDYDV